MPAPSKLLLIFVNEADKLGNVPLHYALVQRLRQLGISGATVHVGTMGFGQHHRVHHKWLFGIADDRPVTVIAVDAESKLRAVLPALREMVREGLLVLLDAEIVGGPSASQP